MTPAKIYQFSIPAGGSFPLLVIGDYCKILTCSGALTLTGDTFGTIGPILAGQGVEDSPFQRLVLTDNTGAVNNGTILIADNKFIDDRITGEVSIIDGGKSRTLSNTAGFVLLAQAAAVGQYSHAQIWNPVGSGKNCYIENLILSSPTAAGTISLRSSILPLTTLAGSCSSKLITSVIPLIESRTEFNAGVLGSGLVSEYVSGVSIQTYHELREPICLQPGIGLIVSGNIVNYGITAMLEFFIENT